ncbi:MAG: RNA-guided endonuclease TnpB family protein [Methanobacterium sp.]
MNYISILINDEKSVPDKQPFNESSTIGVDLGIYHFSINSDGFKVANQRYLKQNLKKLKREQRKLSKKQKDSKNREKQRIKVARVHEKIRNIREDFQHKWSTKLIRENQAICLETLNIKGMLKNKHLAQQITDVSWHSFIEKLKYKAKWQGKSVFRIGQFEPSSKICNNCGHHNTKLELKHRIWTCAECETVHDRDVNAAINIKEYALDKQNIIGNENFQISISKTNVLKVP